MCLTMDGIGGRARVAWNCPKCPPWTALYSALGGGQVEGGQMGTEGKLYEFIMFSLCFGTIQKLINYSLSRVR